MGSDSIVDEPASAGGEAKLDADLAPGTMVGKFRVDAIIGSGGFGTVYRAVNDIDKVAAIKVLRLAYSADPEMVSRFKAEARAVNQIRHKNIIDIFEFGRLPDGRQYLVMEYLDGLPLDEHLEDVGRLELATAIPILRCVARALDAAHAKGIAHRDLKPENIFLCRDDDGGAEAKLLDFGIAKLLHNPGGQQHKTRTGAPIGTPYTMSPEQARGRDIDHRTDIYSLGCVVYRVLTGDYPFDGDDYMEVLLKQVSEETPPASAIIGDLPTEVDDAIAWMMSKDPSERPPTATAAVRALEAAAQKSGIAVVSVDGSTGHPIGSGARAVFARSSSGHRMPPSRSVASAETLSVTSGEIQLEPPVGSSRGRKLAVFAFAATAGVAAGIGLYMTTADPASPSGPPPPAPAPAPASASAPAPDPEPAAAPATAANPAHSGSGADADADAGAGKATLITLDVTGAPAGTGVFGPDGAKLGVAPGKLQLSRADRPLALTFRAEGFEPRTADVMPDASRTLEVALKRKRPQRVKPRTRPEPDRDKPRGRDAIEDPFKK